MREKYDDLEMELVSISNDIEHLRDRSLEFGSKFGSEHDSIIPSVASDEWKRKKLKEDFDDLLDTERKLKKRIFGLKEMI